MNDEKGVLMWAIQRPDGSLAKTFSDNAASAWWAACAITERRHIDHHIAQGYRAVRVRVTLVEDGDGQ